MNSVFKSHFIAGLLILAAYFKEPDGYHLAAEHDKIYVYATDSELSLKEVDKMVMLGWTQEMQRGQLRNTTNDFNATDYDAGESWIFYV